MATKRLLVVDDEQSIRDLLKQAFSQNGYDVITAGSAEEALETQKSDTRWIIISDLNLPGMNGLELCKKIRSEYPFAIVYAITGYASMYELADCREAGFEDYFTKPVDLRTLITAADNAASKLTRWRGGKGT